MLIHFVHTGDAYLPELQAYVAFVQAAGHQAQIHHHIDSVPGDAAVLWWMCGQVRRQLAQRCPTAFHIHEYASTSVPPLAWLKDRVKHWHQALPHYRIYQNPWVCQRLSFSDGVPYEFRDMGVAPEFFNPPLKPVEPEFDFVYLGDMRRLSHFLPVFEALAQLGRTVLLIGQVPDDLKSRFQRHTNLIFSGRVPHQQVPAQLRRARYGLNLIPDQVPFTYLTSTKLLEYCAVGLPVVSTDYAWVRQFEKLHGARFSYLPCYADADIYRTLLGLALDQQLLLTPDVRSLSWSSLLSKMHVWRRIGMLA
ncbi:MAG: glycosyltransferase [Rhodoferax sp.]